MPVFRKILFVCVGNTCRSQMAEGFARHWGRDIVEARSAGTSAMGYINSATVETMKELGIDISKQASKQLTPEMLEWADVVVTLGCRRADSLCGADFKGKKYDWPIADPLGKPEEFMRLVRDDIKERVKGLISDE